MYRLKFYILNSWWIYLLISIIMGFILFCPLFISISKNYEDIAYPYNFSSLYLGTTIPILVISNLLLISYAYFEYRTYKIKLNFNNWIKKFFYNILFLNIQSILQFVIFIIIWLIPFDKHGDMSVILKDIAHTRIMLYAIFGSITTVLFAGLNLYLNLYNKYLIMFKLKKEKNAY